MNPLNRKILTGRICSFLSQECWTFKIVASNNWIPVVYGLETTRYPSFNPSALSTKSIFLGNTAIWHGEDEKSTYIFDKEFSNEAHCDMLLSKFVFIHFPFGWRKSNLWKSAFRFYHHFQTLLVWLLFIHIHSANIKSIKYTYFIGVWVENMFTLILFPNYMMRIFICSRIFYSIRICGKLTKW